MDRDPGIEGLRGVAALSVLLAHAALLKDGAFTGDSLVGLFIGLGLQGVSLFFVLSGYLLYRPFAESVVVGRKTPDIRAFLRNRLLRIFPAYLVVFIVAAFVLGAVVTRAAEAEVGGVPQEVGYLTDPLLILLNLTLTQGYVPEGQMTGLSVSWSLVPELAFYAALPALWLLARRLGRDGGKIWAALAPCVLLVVIGGVSRLFFSMMPAWSEDGLASISGASWSAVLAHSILVQADLFAAGMFAAVVVVMLENGDPESRAARTTTARRVAFALLAVAVVALLPARGIHGVPPVIALGVASLLVVLGTNRANRFRTAVIRVLETAFLRRAGLISYSLYLWHLPLAMFLAEHLPGIHYSSPGGLLVAVGSVLGIAWVFSEVTYRLVERPALARKHRMMHLVTVVPPRPAQTPAPEPQ